MPELQELQQLIEASGTAGVEVAEIHATYPLKSSMMIRILTYSGSYYLDNLKIFKFNV